MEVDLTSNGHAQAIAVAEINMGFATRRMLPGKYTSCSGSFNASSPVIVVAACASGMRCTDRDSARPASR